MLQISNCSLYYWPKLTVDGLHDILKQGLQKFAKLLYLVYEIEHKHTFS